ncbi:MAG: carboxymuconolactone decarboxylase [Rhodospirillales bacterium CG15_BIG_FIL_POST_REV_8_21_14_020_66_15]|nr:MAG: carboxymuconolactone decarboxylase [Rhodospirillales bacterium CG15_BIG_FIL_POST_REV_8_21_14_020_66_15]
MTYKVHSIESAPAAAKEVLEGVRKNFGFIPNLLGVMAEAPALAKAYRTLAGLFEETSFSPTERQTVLLAISSENGCTYCVAAHSVIAGMQQVPQEVVGAIRDGVAINDSKLEALRQFAVAVNAKRGNVSDDDINQFFAAGYSPAQVLEVVLAVGFKTLSNFTNHITETPLDEAFSQARWTKAA